MTYCSIAFFTGNLMMVSDYMAVTQALRVGLYFAHWSEKVCIKNGFKILNKNRFKILRKKGLKF